MEELYGDVEKKNWLMSIFISLPKKSSALKYEEYIFINLMSHAHKIFLDFHTYRNLEENLNEQFGLVS